jgi:hypothetical protein
MVPFCPLLGELSTTSQPLSLPTSRRQTCRLAQSCAPVQQGSGQCPRQQVWVFHRPALSCRRPWLQCSSICCSIISPSRRSEIISVRSALMIFDFLSPPLRFKSPVLATRLSPGLAMSLPIHSYISAVTLLIFTAGNVLAREGQATTATASADNRGDACAKSIEKVINFCMMRELNNIGPVKCDCVQDGPRWTCTGVASCVK